MNIFREVFDFWVESWKTNKLIFCIEMACAILGITASTMMNVWSDNPNMLPIISMYCVSAMGWVYTSYYRKNAWLVILMGYYTFIGIVGLINLA